MPKQDSEQFRFVARTLWPDSETLLLRPQEPFEPMGERTWILAGLVRIEGTTRAYSPSPRHCPRSASCTASADLNPVDEAAPESNVEIIEHRRGIPFLHRHAFWLAA